MGQVLQCHLFSIPALCIWIIVCVRDLELKADHPACAAWATWHTKNDTRQEGILGDVWSTTDLFVG